ncbi:hypothetical protein LJR225_003263 [Phenylobacterium sp. LjRoot225]|uniref:TetR/AcrR family transcriptional regulator n=1 Tax=Phenylobacterium sp. LjRoot225 TaxID=3342285 RepID=UPI003ED1513B
MRELAAGLGTSDRMLLYYFEDKADLVAASLEAVSSRLARVLDTAISAGPMAPAAFLSTAMVVLRSEAVSPFMSVWSDICAHAVRAEEPFRSIAQRLTEAWAEWVAQRLDMDIETARRDAAMALLAVIEGARLLESLRPGSAAQITAGLGPALSGFG